MADPINTGFDTEFSDPLTKFRAALDAQGIKTNIISGVRDSAKQAQLYYNYIHGIGGQGLAAPPGTSLHERGLAADIQPANPADLPKMVALAKQYGIAAPYQAQGSHYDPYHFQLANWQQAEATQAPNTPWGSLADQPTQYASNVADASTPNAGGGFAVPGTSLNTTGPDRLSSMVGTLESGGGRYSSAQPKSMVDPFYGQYPGFANTYGRGPSGINNYAQAVMAANPKASVGDFYAGYFSGTGKPGLSNFNNFDLLSKGAIQNTPGTPAAQKAAAANFVKNAGVDPGTSLASIVGSPQPSIPGVSGAIDPSIAAHASTTPAAAAPMTAGDWIRKPPLRALTARRVRSRRESEPWRRRLAAETTRRSKGSSRRNRPRRSNCRRSKPLLLMARNVSSRSPPTPAK